MDPYFAGHPLFFTTHIGSLQYSPIQRSSSLSHRPNIMGANYNLDKQQPVKIESLPISTRENQDDREDSYRSLSTLNSTEIDANLVDSIYKVLKKVESAEFDSLWQECPGKALSPSAKHAASTYRRTLCLGLKGLLGEITIPYSQVWEDAGYAIATICVYALYRC